MFQTNRLINFVFTNGNDLYYPNAAMELELGSYLWYQLNKDGFENVFTLSEKKGSYSVSVYDRKAGEVFSAYRKKPLTKFFGLKVSTLREGYQVFDDNSADFTAEWMVEMSRRKNRQEKNAIVLPMHVLNRIFSGQADALAQLIDSGTKSGNTLSLIVTLDSSEDSLADQLFGEQSVLCQDYRHHSLCDELSMITRKPAAPLFTTMSAALGKGCIFLCSPNKNQIQNLLLHNAMEQDCWDASPAEIQKQSEFLALWIRNKQLQKDIQLGWNPGQTVKYTELKQQLSNPRFVHALSAASEVFSAASIRPDAYELTRSDRLSSEILQLSLPQEYLDSRSVLESMQQKKQLEELREKATVIWTKPENKNVLDWIEKALSSFHYSAGEKDWNTLEYNFTLLRFCVDHICLESRRTTEFEKLCEVYEQSVIQVSRQYTKEQKTLETQENMLLTATGNSRKELETYRDIHKIKMANSSQILKDSLTKLSIAMQSFDTRQVNLSGIAETLGELAKHINQDNLSALNTYHQYTQQKKVEMENLSALDVPDSEFYPEEAEDESLEDNTVYSPIVQDEPLIEQILQTEDGTVMAAPSESDTPAPSSAQPKKSADTDAGRKASLLRLMQ